MEWILIVALWFVSILLAVLVCYVATRFLPIVILKLGSWVTDQVNQLLKVFYDKLQAFEDGNNRRARMIEPLYKVLYLWTKFVYYKLALKEWRACGHKYMLALAMDAIDGMANILKWNREQENPQCPRCNTPMIKVWIPVKKKESPLLKGDGLLLWDNEKKEAVLVIPPKETVIYPTRHKSGLLEFPPHSGDDPPCFGHWPAPDATICDQCAMDYECQEITQDSTFKFPKKDDPKVIREKVADITVEKLDGSGRNVPGQ